MSEEITKRVFEFVKTHEMLTVNELTVETTMGDDLGLAGDDADEFMESFFIEFDIQVVYYDRSRFFYGEGSYINFLTPLVWRMFNGTKMPKYREPERELTMRDLVLIKATERHFQDFDWLKTYWLFSFDTYRDPNNMNFGKIRVYNDDIVAQGQGFVMHAHREMEIISIIHTGEISHEDSMGNKTTIKAGEVQRMSAGSGITHSEFNKGTEPLHLHQIWIFPHTAQLEPSYEQKDIRSLLGENKNELVAVVSGEDPVDSPLSMNADASIHMAELDSGKSVDFVRREDRKIFIYITDGSFEINGEKLDNNDQVRISDGSDYIITAESDCKFILIDVP